MPARGSFKIPVPERRYGEVEVTGTPFRGPGNSSRGIPCDTWWIPCLCTGCGKEFDANWPNLRQGLITRCNSCRQTANSQRLKDSAAAMARARVLNGPWSWYDSTEPYVYAIAYPDVLKIGYAARHPALAVSSANTRFKDYAGYEARGAWLWHKQPAVYADEAVLQGICNKAYGQAFTLNRKCTRMSEWVKCSDVAAAISRLDSAWEFAQAL